MTPTAAQERERFVALTRGQLTAEEENEEQRKFMNQTRNRMTNLDKRQKSGMPKVCQGMEYSGPVIATHKAEKNGNNCVITNDTHAKATNNGYSRGDSGRFFCH